MHLTEQKITQTLESNYMPYAMSVIVSRAIPEIDGLKPSHRKLLYTMYKMGLLTGNRTKSANVVGQTMRLNPHGDMAIYETLVRLTRGYDALLLPLIDSKGNFGKQNSRDMAFAASRYTEVKLDKICQELFRDIDKDTVEFIDNYDGTTQEPMLLPAAFPHILVNPNQGIAVGMASNICSFNLREICETTIAYLEDEGVDIMKTLLAPDFSTGGQLIYKQNELREIYYTGRGSFKVRAKYRHDKKNSMLEIYEIPYTTTVEAIMDKILDLVKTGKIRDISDMRDETDLNGLKLTLEIKKSTDPDKLMNILYKLTPLMDTFSCNFNLLINGMPQVLGIKNILFEWSIFRTSCIKRQLQFDIGKKSEKLHLLMGLKKILLDIDKAIRIIRHTEKEADVIPNLMQGFEIDLLQAEYICEIRLRNLNKEYILKRTDEVDSLAKDIADMRDTLSNEKKVRKIIIAQLKEIAKQYGKERRTEIIEEEHVAEITHEHLIEDFNLRLFLTKQNYLKKISLVSLRAAAEHKLKDEDSMMQEIETSNKEEILFFSTKQAVYKMKIHEIPDCKASALGEYLPNLLGLDEDERIRYMVVANGYQGMILFSFENGKMTKVPLTAYETKTNRKKLANAYYGNSPLVDIRLLRDSDTDLVVTSNINKVLVFNTEAINAKATRDSQGVQVLLSKKGSIMVKVQALEQSELTNPQYYRNQNIPGTGKYLKKEDDKSAQLSLLDE
ncbi:MAG: topoisomerase IV [Hyphomonadaceae bacterium]|nr:topoisomerase IV [Clostridia bacterium]